MEGSAHALSDAYRGRRPLDSVAVLERMEALAERYMREHGFKYEDENAISNPLRCSICGEPMVDPLMAPCGHTFCGACIARWLRQSGKCPIDRQPTTIDRLQPASRIALDMLDELRVQCSLGCGWRGTRGAFKAHLASECTAVELASARSRSSSARRFRFDVGSRGSSAASSAVGGSTPDTSPSPSRRTSYSTVGSLASPALDGAFCGGSGIPSRVGDAWSNHLASRYAPSPLHSPGAGPLPHAAGGPLGSRPPHLHDPSPGIEHALEDAFEGLSMRPSRRHSVRPPSRPPSPSRGLHSVRALSRPSSPSRGLHREETLRPDGYGRHRDDHGGRRVAFAHGGECELCLRTIAGTRWKCLNCPSYHLCENCHTHHAPERHPFHLFVPLHDGLDAAPYQPPSRVSSSGSLSHDYPWDPYT